MRNERYRRLVASLPCSFCGIEGQSQACHSNLQTHGKGMGIKATDAAIFPACQPCHAEFDQGKSYTKEERRNLTHEKIADTYIKLMEQGILKMA